MSRPKPSGRSYGRLTRHERNTVERMLDRNRSAREIAAELGRSPSTVTREVAAHRYVTAPRSSIVSMMPIITASIGLSSVNSVCRAELPALSSTTSPCFAPIMSIATRKSCLPAPASSNASGRESACRCRSP